MKVGVAGYAPPKYYPGAEAFWENIHKFPVATELMLCSETDWPGVTKLKGNPEQFKNAVFIEGKNAGRPNIHALHNALFLASAKIAREAGWDFMIYLEADCRVGCKGWDGIVFDEYFSLGRPTIVAGTCSAWNVSNAGPKVARRFVQEISKKRKHGVPVGCYGWMGAADPGPATWLPNGALAVYDLLWIERLFDFSNMGTLARQNGPFDQAIAQKLWEMFQADAFEVIGYLESILSAYGDVLTTPEERQKLLTDGTVVAVHQIKDSWQP